jgi:hypothetical protein
MKEKNKIKAHRYKEGGKKYKGIDMHSRDKDIKRERERESRRRERFEPEWERDRQYREGRDL